MMNGGHLPFIHHSSFIVLPFLIMPRRKSSLFSIRSPLPKRTAFLLGFVAPALVLGAWCAVSYGHLVRADFLPTPTEVVRGTLQLFFQYDLATAIYASTRRIVLRSEE